MNDQTYAAKVAQKLIEAMEQGIAPWQNPIAGGSRFLPYNPTTGNNYKGMNTVWLMMQGRTDPRWLTYKQASALGAQVQKGEKGTVIQYWQYFEEQNKLDENGKPVLDQNGNPEKTRVQLDRPKLFSAVVFNAEQITGMPPLERRGYDWQPIEKAEEILANSGAVIQNTNGKSAYYSSKHDEIFMPDKSRFNRVENDNWAGVEDYYRVALHELGHWTGHESRLNRDLSNPFGSQEYAKEELRAEISSLMVSDAIGIPYTPNHTAYVQNWIQVLKDDPLELFRAARDAEKIKDFVITPQQKLVQLDQVSLDIKQAEAEIKTLSDNFTRTYGGLLSSSETNAVEELTAIYQDKSIEGVVFEYNFSPDALNFPSDIDHTAMNVAIDIPNPKTFTDLKIVEQDGKYGAFALDPKENAYLPLIKRPDSLPFNNPKQALEVIHIAGLTSAVFNDNNFEKYIQLSALHALDASEAPINKDAITETEQAYIDDTRNALKHADGLLFKYEALLEAKNSMVKAKDGAMDEKNIKAAVNNEKTLINVSYKDKEEAKELGAKWDKTERSWYIPSGVDPSPFAKWTDNQDQEPKQEQNEKQGHKVTQIFNGPAGTFVAGDQIIVNGVVQKPAGEQKPQTPQEKVYLAIPYTAKEEAKELGAKWDKAAKSWYAFENNPNLDTLMKYLPENVETQQAPSMSPREELVQTMLDMGLDVIGTEHPIMDGQKHRVATLDDKKGAQSGFYVAHSDGHPAAYIMNNKTSQETKWKAKGYSLSTEEKSKLAAEAAQKKEERQQAIKASQDRVATSSTQKVEQLRKDGLEAVQTPYIESKGISTHAGIFTDKEAKTTVIPVTNIDGEIRSLQYINEDGVKRFSKDGQKEGCFHVIGGDVSALAKTETIILAEGYATAASITELTGIQTVAAFDSGNLVPVAKALHEKYPEANILIAGDDDQFNKVNTGREKAQEAALAVGGSAIFPVFPPANDKKLTDFNDMVNCDQTRKEGAKLILDMAISDGLKKRQAEASLKVAAPQVKLAKANVR